MFRKVLGLFRRIYVLGYEEVHAKGLVRRDDDLRARQGKREQ
jgi:hypothetical protein